MKDVRDETSSHYPRLDLLDSILEPQINSDFFNWLFTERRTVAVALCILGAVQCGVTRPKRWDDKMYQRLTECGEDAVDEWITMKLKEKQNEG